MAGPQETGTQALSYKGNAALGFGADGIGLINDEQSLASATATVNNTLSQLSQQSQQWNMMKYGQAIQDRNDTENLFSQTAIDQPVSDADMKVLTGKLDDVHNFILADPQKISSDITTNLEAKKKISEFKALQAAAKTRETMFAQMRTDIAKEIDPAVRQNMQDHLDEQQKNNINTQVTPYYKQVDPTQALFSVVPKDISLPTSYDGKGLAYTNTQHNEKDFLDQYSLGYALQHPLFAQNTQLFYNQAKQHPEMMKPENIAGILLKTNKLNSDYGHTDPNDPYYIQPIATKGPDGNYQLTDDPYAYVRGIAAAAKLDSRVKQAYSEDVQKGLKTVAETGKDVAETNKATAEAAIQPTIAAKNRAEASNQYAQATEHIANAKLTDQQRKDLENATPDAQYAINTTNTISEDIDHIKTFDTASYGRFDQSLKDLGLTATVGSYNGHAPIYNQLGIDKTWRVAVVPQNEDVSKILSKPGEVDPTTKKETNPVRPQAMMVFTNPATGEKKLVGFNQTKDNKISITKVVPRDQWPHALLDYQLGYKNKEGDIKQHNQITKVMGGSHKTQTASSDNGDKTKSNASDISSMKQIDVNTSKGVITRYISPDGSRYKLDSNGNLVKTN